MEFRSITHAFQLAKAWQPEYCDIYIFVNAHFADTLHITAKTFVDN